MTVFLQFKLGICSVFWLGYLCVLYQCVYSDFLRRVRAHQCSSCPALDGDKTSVISSVLCFSFCFFGQKFCNCQITSGRLQPLWPPCSALGSRPRNWIYSLRKLLVEQWFQSLIFLGLMLFLIMFQQIQFFKVLCDEFDRDTLKSEGNVQKHSSPALLQGSTLDLTHMKSVPCSNIHQMTTILNLKFQDNKSSL